MKSVKILAVLLALSVAGVVVAASKTETTAQTVTNVKCTANTTCSSVKVPVASTGTAIQLKCQVLSNRGQVQSVFAPSSVTLTYDDNEVAQSSMFFQGNGMSYPNSAGTATPASESFQGLDFKYINGASNQTISISAMNCSTPSKGVATAITLTNS